MIRQSTYLRRVLKEAIRQGWIIRGVDDGDGINRRIRTVRGTVAAISAVDLGHIFLKRATPASTPVPAPAGPSVSPSAEAWIFCVWQGPDEKYAEGEEILSDYTVNLDSVITAVESTLKEG